MNKLVLILIAMIAIIYFRYYLSANPHFEILQSSIENVKPSLLFEQSPLIIEEPLVNPGSLTKTLFKYLYVLKRDVATTLPNVLMKNKAKYLIISPISDAGVIQISHPRHSALIRRAIQKKDIRQVPIANVKLNPNQCMILPMHWWYKTDTSQYRKIELDDVLSLLLCKF
jgi:hypothetical protein